MDSFEQNYLEYFYNYPVQNGFLYFTLGALLILSVYHFLLYFQQKDKLYLLYSGYTFFIILSQSRHLEEGFLYHLFLMVKQFTAYPMIYTEIYYGLYVIFALRFLNIKKYFPKWNKYILRSLTIIMLYCLVLLIIHFFTGEFGILLKGYFIFTILISILGLVIYIPFFKVKSPLKYYMIFGSFFLFLFSVVSLLIYIDLGSQGISQEPAFSVLYVGFLLENTLFSLGLGHKQKLVLKERNSSQEKLIKQLKENEKLRERLHRQLEQEVKAMGLEAESERLKTLNIKYDKELAELKLLALRSQMNPHFIFNSLNSVKRYIIDNDKGKAVYYMNKFSKLIRRVLSSTMEKESSLADELETMELYASIENIRFNNQIKFDIKVAESVKLATIKIPSLLLQPFLENAIWHGLSPKKTNMKLGIEVIKPDTDHIRIDIIDNGIGREKAQAAKNRKLHARPSVGIYLSTERLKHFGQKLTHKGSIVFEDLIDKKNNSAGTKVSVTVPLK